MRKQPATGTDTIDIPRRAKTKHCQEREARPATVIVRFGSFGRNPPRHTAQHPQEELPDIDLNAVDVLERNPPAGEEPVEWRLLTNLPVTSVEQADAKVRWYCLRWRIEMYFNVLKSGLRVEAGRLEQAERLTRYLAVMSIGAWRLFLITRIARTDPSVSCATFLAGHEWQVLFRKATGRRSLPTTPPCIGNAVIGVAKLGGYRARKNDGPPGTLTLWRGWKRLADLTEGWQMAVQP
jgi:hypothetical protein